MKQYFDDKGISTKDYTDIEIDFWSNSWDNAAKRSAEGFKIVNVDSFHLYGNTGRDKRDVVNVEHIFNNWTPVTFSASWYGSAGRSESSRSKDCDVGRYCRHGCDRT